MTLHQQTPVEQSATLDATLNKAIFFKMECDQPVRSFKIRGIGALCEHLAEEGATPFISSSGGNAGYAAAYAGRKLGIPTVVVVPETTSQTAKERMTSQGAEVIVHGAVWDEADAHARQLVDEQSAGYIHPFEHPIIWDGHATLIDEAAQQMPTPDVVVVAVGGGGLMCGILQGMHRNGWEHVPVIAVETEGAASFAAALAAGELVELPAITSIAKTLGAATVTQKTLDWAQKHSISAVTVSDEAAVDACLRFADDFGRITEPACGAALSLAYGESDYLRDYERVLIIACGGAGVTDDQLRTWQREGVSS